MKEKDEKDIAAYGAKGNPSTVKKGLDKAEKSKKKKQEDKEDEEDEEERKKRKPDKEDMVMNKLVLVKFFSCL